MATIRSTEGFTWPPKHWSNPYESCCTIAIVTTNAPREGIGRVATNDSVGLRICNDLTGRATVYGLDGSFLARGEVDRDGKTGEWGVARGAEAGLQDRAKATLERLLTDPAALEAEIGKP